MLSEAEGRLEPNRLFGYVFTQLGASRGCPGG